MEAPEGLRYVETFLGPEEQSDLLRVLTDIHDWQPIRFRGQVARRRKLAYGWNYDPADRALSPADPFPSFLVPLRDHCAAAAGIPAERLVQSTVTFYPPGAGIGPHRDAPFFGDEVVGVSLGSDAQIVFRHAGEKYPLRLAPGSLLAIRGPARRTWTHELRPVSAARYSIYFRSLRDHPPRS
jgi:alkylated DNA repair dioxygenase AlkB